MHEGVDDGGPQAGAQGLRGRRRDARRSCRWHFLILLPFYASLPAMLSRRLAHGLWFDTIGLMVFSASLPR